MLTLAIGLVVCNRTAVIGMYWCSIILAGFGGGGIAANALDIAPAYAGMYQCHTISRALFASFMSDHRCDAVMDLVV